MDKGYIYKRRLLKLADFLFYLPEKRFYFGNYVGDDWQGNANLSCGTTACGFGWATTIPSFRRLGLRLGRPFNQCNPRVGLVQDDGPPFDWQAPMRAADHVFGLNEDEFYFIFMPNALQFQGRLEDQIETYGCTALPTHASAKDLARHIRRFVKHKYGK